MNKVYDMNWLINEIDNNLTIILYNKDKSLGTYHVDKVITNTQDEISIKFANIEDLNNFINLSFVRFKNTNDLKSIIDIPINKLYLLFSKLEKNVTIPLDDLNAFSIYKDKMINKDYYILINQTKEISDEFKKVINIAHNYQTLGMQEKFDALEDINLINYHKEKDNILKR